MSQAVDKRKHRKDYTPQERNVALTAYALANGNSRKASDFTKEELGVRIPKTTIDRWARHMYPDDYQRIQAEVMPRIHAQMADAHHSLAHRAMEIEARTLERLSQEIHNLDPQKLSTTMRDAAVAGAIHSDKGLIYSGQPTSIVRHEVGEVMRSLKAKGIELEGDVVDAQVVDEETVAA